MKSRRFAGRPVSKKGWAFGKKGPIVSPLARQNFTRLLVLFLVFAPTLATRAEQRTTPIDVPAGSTLMFTAKGEGVQIYTCTEGRWVLKGPDAKLLDGHGKQLGTHFAGPTWKLQDGSEVKGKAIASQPSTDSTSVAWLLLQAVPGSGTGKLAAVTYIRRTATHGGAASTDGCTGGELSIPYTATYSFYTNKADGKPANWVPASPVK